MTLEFSNLPLEEVAVRAIISITHEFTLNEICDLRKKLADDFELVEGLPGVELSPFAPTQLSLGKYPGLFLRQGNAETIIQGNMIIARWRRLSGAPYPRYPFLKQNIWCARAALSEIVGSESAALSIVNMAYTNVVIVSEPLTFGDAVSRYVRAACVPLRVKAGQVNDQDLSWKESNGVDYRVRLQPGQIMLDSDGTGADSTRQSRPALILTTICGTYVRPDLEPEQALDLVHHALQESFLTVVSDEALEEWGYAGRT